MEHSCFWALLSYGDLHFIYLPLSVAARDHFFGRSFFDFVHPDEVVFARQDLTTFMQGHTLGGSVTRCRLRDLKNMQTCTTRDSLFSNGDAWLVADVIMYVVTEGLILAFFHCDIDGNDQKSQYKAPLKCGDYHYKVDEAHETINILRSHDAYHSNGNLYSKSNSASQRIFQILDNRSKHLLVSWPDGYDNTQSSNPTYNKMITSSLFDTTSKSDKAMKSLDTLQDSGLTCIQRTCINSCSSYLCGTSLKTLERVLITYGNIVFGLFRLSDSKSTISKVVKDESARIPSISTITMGIPNAKPISATTKPGITSTISSINHTETTCTESHSAKTASTTNNNQIRETSRAVMTGKESMSTHASDMQHDYSHSNLLIPYARRMCNFPQLSPISESPNTRNFASRPSESYFRSNQPKNPTSTHACESCGTDSSPEWRRGPSGHKTLCNACGLRYSRSLARQTKAIQQREAFNGDGATMEEQISPQKRPLSESDLPLLPPPYFRPPTHHISSLAKGDPFPQTLSSLSNICDEQAQRVSSRAREPSDRSRHSATVHFRKLC